MNPSARTPEEQAALWADRRRRGEMDAAADQALRAWLAEGPDRARLLDTQERLLADPALAAVSARLAAEAGRSRGRAFPSLTSASSRFWIGGLAAAACAALAVLIWPSSPAVVERKLNGTVGGALQAALDDGSVVQLNGDSRVRTAFGPERRDVWLSGEGFFSVAKDARRPFSVMTATHRITALGTRFNVDERSVGAVEVTVLEGRVEVVPLNHPERRQLLTAGRRLLSEGDGAAASAVQRLDADVTTPDWTEGWIDADHMSLADLLIELKRRSPGLKAELADAGLSRRRISGRFAASDPQGVLTAVADMQGLTLRRDASGRLLIDR